MPSKVGDAIFEAIERGFGDDDHMSVFAERLEQHFMAEYPKNVWGHIYAQVMIAAVCRVGYGVSVGSDLMCSFFKMNALFEVDPSNLGDCRDVVQHLQSIDQHTYGEIVSATPNGPVNVLSITVSGREASVFAACKAFTDGELIPPDGVT